MTDIPDWAFEEADKHFIPVQTEVSVEAVRKVVARAIMAATERAASEAVLVALNAEDDERALIRLSDPRPVAEFLEIIQGWAETDPTRRVTIRRDCALQKPANDDFASIPHNGEIA